MAFFLYKFTRMKKLFILILLYFTYVSTANAQYVPPNAKGDIVIPGSNAWLLHTPDDGRTILYITPWGGTDWNWNINAEFANNGDVLFKGKFRVGARIPQTQPDYRLSVDGKLVAQSVCVTNPSTWADFVFDPTYRPMSLPSLEAYLWRNKHLPAIPAASEVEAHGYNVSDMDAKLLQSIEELTLHVIALNKKQMQLEAEKAELTLLVIALSKKVAQLETAKGAANK
jgi:hypothetical protein